MPLIIYSAGKSNVEIAVASSCLLFGFEEFGRRKARIFFEVEIEGRFRFEA